MKSNYVLCLVFVIAMNALSGCVNNNVPAPIAPKYSAAIMSIDDVTYQHPEMLNLPPGWYDPLSKNKSFQYSDTGVGMYNRRMTVYLVWASPPSLYLSGFLTQNQSYYWVYDNVLVGVVDGNPTNSGFRVWAVNLQYDIPPENEIPFCAENIRCMGLNIMGAGSVGYGIRFYPDYRTGFS